jgi:ubiquinone/menaquinone biosynthesis C-methylase UbiE
MTDEAKRASVADQFDGAHAARRNVGTINRVHRTAYGDDYPVEVSPSAFYSRSVLRRMMTALQLRPGSTLADLGCGNGGVALWVAQQFDCNVIGIDLSPVGVATAAARSAEVGLSQRATYRTGDMTATALPNASCDAAISLDVLAFVPDKKAAAAEVARVLKSGGRFGFTTWEQSGFSQRLNAEQCPDHRSLLEAAGFEVEIHEEPARWREQQRAFSEGIIAAESALAEEMEPAAHARYLAMARGMLADLAVRRYVMGVARKR